MIRRSWMALALAGGLDAAFEAQIPSATEIVMGDGRVALAAPGVSCESNPALAAQGGWRAGAGSSHPFGIEALDLSGYWAGSGARGIFPGWQVRWKALQAGDLYREDQIGIDLAKGFGRWSLGAGWRGGRTELAGIDGGWSHGLSAGALWCPTRRLSVGAAWEDVSALGVPDSRAARPWTLRAGASASGDDSGWMSMAGFEMLQDEPIRWSLGQELRLGILRLRGGVSFEPWILAFGAGVRWNGIGLDWARQGDPRLGWQQHWTISVER